MTLLCRVRGCDELVRKSIGSRRGDEPESRGQCEDRCGRDKAKTPRLERYRTGKACAERDPRTATEGEVKTSREQRHRKCGQRCRRRRVRADDKPERKQYADDAQEPKRVPV